MAVISSTGQQYKKQRGRVVNFNGRAEGTKDDDVAPPIRPALAISMTIQDINMKRRENLELQVD